MYIKRGTFIISTKSDNPILEAPSGMRFEVSYVAAFIWDLLDGERSSIMIAQSLKEAGNLQDEDLLEVVTKIISELEQVGLVQDNEYELRK